ncbi:MAG: hypothetical protein EA401_09890 [Planctomycetota bacterium]|nr:MAG: hypothetical protein EA401_09890 [Planctomycetota bacterium]
MDDPRGVNEHLTDKKVASFRIQCQFGAHLLGDRNTTPIGFNRSCFVVARVLLNASLKRARNKTLAQKTKSWQIFDYRSGEQMEECEGTYGSQLVGGQVLSDNSVWTLIAAEKGSVAPVFDCESPADVRSSEVEAREIMELAWSKLSPLDCCIITDEHPISDSDNSIIEAKKLKKWERLERLDRGPRSQIHARSFHMRSPSECAGVTVLSPLPKEAVDLAPTAAPPDLLRYNDVSDIQLDPGFEPIYHVCLRCLPTRRTKAERRNIIAKTHEDLFIAGHCVDAIIGPIFSDGSEWQFIGGWPSQVQRTLDEPAASQFCGPEAAKAAYAILKRQMRPLDGGVFYGVIHTGWRRYRRKNGCAG